MRVLLPLLLVFGAGCVERSITATPGGVTQTSTAKTCPQPKPDAICTKEYKPVVCDGCEYANGCLAGAAGFKAEQCAPKAAEDGKKTCPTPKPDVVCTMEYAPVKCDGCVYPNACAAGAAGFKKEQCVPAPGED